MYYNNSVEKKKKNPLVQSAIVGDVDDKGESWVIA